MPAAQRLGVCQRLLGRHREKPAGGRSLEYPEMAQRNFTGERRLQQWSTVEHDGPLQEYQYGHFVQD